MIRKCDEHDFETILAIINDGACAYKGIIPEDRWKEPYMSRLELQHEIDDGVEFWGCQENGDLAAVMGIQNLQDVTLIRHAYVRTSKQKSGLGTKLLCHLQNLTTRPVLIGTWAAAEWAIRFYEKHGFQSVGREQKNALLKRYWSIPERQIETSVVLVDPKWLEVLSPR
jgi:N-acetylglutamate synthase-like GNAT family acetyltransferase